MKKLFILIIIVLIILFYRGLSGEGDKEVIIAPIKIALAEQNDSKEQGQAVLTEVDGQVKVIVEITGSPTGVSQPAHIHFGSCTTLGEPIYDLSAVMDGRSETTLTASFETIQASLPLAINIHKSTTEPAVYVACGDIIL